MSPSICSAAAADCIVRFVSQRVLGIPKKKKNFVGEKFRTLPFKTFHMEFNFVLSNRPKKVKQEDRVRSGHGKSGKSMDFVFENSRPGNSMEVD